MCHEMSLCDCDFVCWEHQTAGLIEWKRSAWSHNLGSTSTVNFILNPVFSAESQMDAAESGINTDP